MLPEDFNMMALPFNVNNSSFFFFLFFIQKPLHKYSVLPEVTVGWINNQQQNNDGRRVERLRYLQMVIIQLVTDMYIFQIYWPSNPV